MPVRATLTLVTGASPAARERCIAALLGATVPGASCAVILEGLADAASPLLPASHLSVSRIAGGCLCCAGHLVLRVTLNRLLRQHPDRVYIGLGRSDHLDQLRSWLASAPYDQLLELADDVQAAP
jgi:hypothetical protein